MYIPSFLTNCKRITFYALVVLSLAFGVSAQKISDNPVPEAEAGDLDQCRNGDGTVACAGTAWVNGNLNAQQSKYAEDQYTPYRLRLTGLAANTTYTVLLGYDVKHSGAHALDYLGSYNTLTISDRATNTVAVRPGVDPCGTLCTLGSPGGTAPITLDTVAVTSQPNPNLGGTIYQPSNQVMTIWNAHNLTFAYNSIDGNVATDNQVERTVVVTFTTDATNTAGTTVVLAWSGHIGWAGDWGDGNSAGGISGSPYHMRFHGLADGVIGPIPIANNDGRLKGGNQDRSMSADAVGGTGALVVRKMVQTANCQNFATTVFGFSASSNFFATNPDTFSLQDLNANAVRNPPVAGQPPYLCDGQSGQLPTPGNGVVSQIISTFDGVANVMDVTESPISGWTLSDISCATATDPVATTSISSGRGVRVTLQQFKVITCTFTNTNSASTAAPASVGGRITTAYGRAISGVYVTLTDVVTGEMVATRTNTFGYYRFDNVDITASYELRVQAKRYSFSNDSVILSLSGDSFNNDFVASN